MSLSDLLDSYTDSYIFKPLKLFSDVRIFPAAISKQSTFSEDEMIHLTRTGFRWYIYYDYVHPVTGKMERQQPVHKGVNRFSDFNERRSHIFHLKTAMEELLKSGYSPYQGTVQSEEYTAVGAIDFALDLKHHSTSKTTHKDYLYRGGMFKTYLRELGIDQASIKHVDKKIVNNFLNNTLANSSARNRNNHRTALSALFSVMEENELIAVNFVRSIKNVQSQPKRNQSYSEQDEKRIVNYLKKNDPYLLTFIQICSYCFFRPIEVVRLTCGDVDLKNLKFFSDTKTKRGKTKIIPEIAVPILSAFDLSNPDHFLFTVGEKPGLWGTAEINKREYFTKRFHKHKKVLKIGADQAIYSFRHTFTLRLYRELRKSNSVNETMGKLMLITGHTSVQGLRNYLRSLDAELPNDWSDMIK